MPMNSEIDFGQFYDGNAGRKAYTRSNSTPLYNTVGQRRIRSSSESTSSLTKEMVSIVKFFYVCNTCKCKLFLNKM